MAPEENLGNFEDLDGEDPEDSQPSDLQARRIASLEKKFNEISKIATDQAELLKLLQAERDTFKKKLEHAESASRAAPTQVSTPALSGAFGDLKALVDIVRDVTNMNRATFEAGIKSERTAQARVERQMAMNYGGPLEEMRGQIEDLKDDLTEAAENKKGMDSETVKALAGTAEGILARFLPKN